MDERLSLIGGTGASRVALRRVCLVVGQLGLGGTEKQVVLLADGLRRHGVEVIVVVLFSTGPRADALRAAGVPVVEVNLPHLTDWRRLPAIAAGCGRFVAQLRRFRPDVVHAFLFHSYVLAAPIARLARVPVVVAGRRSLGDFKRHRRLALLLERLATGVTDLLVANADAVADDVRREERVPERKLAVIYNGLPPSAFVPTEPAELDAARPIVLCVANLKHYKGHSYLLEAIALLRDRGLPTTVVLVGDGPEHDTLRRQATRLDIDVRLLGSRTDVERLLARADVVVHPSLTEGMSNAVMEAMAVGLPVIATAVGGTPELLADGRGLLVPSADPMALADALHLVLSDGQVGARLGDRAREWCRNHLHADVMIERHLAIYDELLSQRCAA
jgi:L-malate glycosyltransferase